MPVWTSAVTQPQRGGPLLHPFYSPSSSDTDIWHPWTPPPGISPTILGEASAALDFAINNAEILRSPTSPADNQPFQPFDAEEEGSKQPPDMQANASFPNFDFAGSRRQTRRPSLTNNNHCLGDALVLPYLIQETSVVTSVSTAIVLAQRVGAERNADAIAKSIALWLHVSQENKIKDRVRMEAMGLFKMWCLDSDGQLLSFGDYDVFINRRLLPSDFLDNSLIKQLLRTIWGMILVNLLSDLFRAQILTGGDIALACEVLFEQHEKAGYMRALYAILSRSGPTGYLPGHIVRLRKVQKDLTERREFHPNRSLPEVDCYIDAVIEIIDVCVPRRTVCYV